ncbi:MAG: hypothetical protein WC460_03870 [Patescibacteria group bacterium]
MLAKIKNFFLHNKTAQIYLLNVGLVVFILLIVFYPLTVHADILSGIVSNAFNSGISIIIFILNAFIKLFGSLLTVVMGVLTWIAQYNKFIDNPYVNEGWVILRDLVNMFFVLGLLFIAFVTVLGIEKQPWNKLLARLLIMAIMVNFSKTICGLIIDFFQVLMLTFVNAFKDITSGNIEKALGMENWFKILPTATGAQGEITGGTDWRQGLTAVAGSLLGLIYVMVAFIVVLIFCVVLAFRMVALWILVVFSPLAFFAWAFEGAAGKVGKFANEWWDQFFNYCVVGPCIAFFLWISLITMAKLNYDQMNTSVTAADRAKINADIGAGSSMDQVLSVLIGIIMLVSGLTMCSKYAGAAAGVMTKGANFIKDQTAGRLERAATRVGRETAGVVGAPFRAAGAMAKLPFKALKPFATGAAEGAKERLQRGPFSRLLTKEGRAQTAEAMRERGRALVPGVGRLGIREMRAKQAEDFKKIRKDINWENPDQIRKIQEAAIERDPKTSKITRVENKDRRFWESTYTALADAGKLKYSDIEDMKSLPFYQEMQTESGDRGRQVFLEDMEKRYEKKTQIKKAFSSLIYNADTNEYDDIEDLEERSDTAKSRAKTAGRDLSGIDFNKIRRKKDDGTYEFDVNSDEYKNLAKNDPDNLAYLQNLQAQGTGTKSDFYALARSTEIREKKFNEIRKAAATASEPNLNEAGKQANLGDIIQNPPDYAVAEIDGFTDQIPRIGKLDKIARDNVNAKARFLMGDNRERAALIEANKNLFDKSLHRQENETENEHATRLGGMSQIKKIDDIKGKMKEEQLEKFQNLIIESSSQFNAIGQKLPGGEGQSSANLDSIIRQKRVQSGVTAGLKAFIPNVNDLEFVDAQAAQMLAQTADFPREDRINKISIRLAVRKNLPEENRNKIAEYLIDNEVIVRTREKKEEAVKEKVKVNIKTTIDEVKKQVQSRVIDQGKIEFAIDNIIFRINKEITEGALPEETFKPELLKQELSKLVEMLGKFESKEEATSAVKKVEDAVEALGYKVKTQKGKKK